MKRILPAYFLHGGDVAMSQPYALSRTALTSFLLPAKSDSLQNLLDRWFYQVSGGAVRYHALFPFVALVFARAAKATSTSEPDKNYGWLPEVDVAFWVPAVAFEPLRFAWFLPYVFVDSPYAMASGREVYGFPKITAQFQLPDDPAKPERLSVDVLGFKNYSPQSEAAVYRIIEVAPQGKADSQPPEAENITSFDSAIDLFIKHSFERFSPLTGASSLMTLIDSQNLMNSLKKKLFNMVFLKQFRDIEFPDRACYQSIVEAEADPGIIHKMGVLMRKFSVRIEDLESHPLTRDLGIESENTAFPVFWSEFDFVMKTGCEIWKA